MHCCLQRLNDVGGDIMVDSEEAKQMAEEEGNVGIHMP